MRTSTRAGLLTTLGLAAALTTGCFSNKPVQKDVYDYFPKAQVYTLTRGDVKAGKIEETTSGVYYLDPAGFNLSRLFYEENDNKKIRDTWHEYKINMLTKFEFQWVKDEGFWKRIRDEKLTEEEVMGIKELSGQTRDYIINKYRKEKREVLYTLKKKKAIETIIKKDIEKTGLPNGRAQLIIEEEK